MEEIPNHVLKHVEVTQEDLKIIGSHFKNNRVKERSQKKIAEALLIKQERLFLNVQGQSVELKLLN